MSNVDTTNILSTTLPNTSIKKRGTRRPPEVILLEKQQKVINDVVEKKLTLAKLQSTIWEKSSNKEDDNMSLSDIDDDMLQSLIAKDTEQIQSDKPYRLK